MKFGLGFRKYITAWRTKTFGIKDIIWYNKLKNFLLGVFMIQTIILASVTFLIACLFMFIRTTQGTGLRALLLKTLASFSFVVLGIIVCFDKCDYMSVEFAFLIIGLVAGMLGDIFLDLKYTYPEHYNQYTSAGIVAFSICHLCYLAFIIFVSNASLLMPCIIASAVAICAVLFILLFGKSLLKLDFGEHKLLSLIYTAILFFVVGFSVVITISNVNFILFTVGEALILVSDLILSMIYFGNKRHSKFLSNLNHTLYYAGQILIACCLLLIF